MGARILEILRPPAHLILGLARQALHARGSLLVLGEIEGAVLFPLQDAVAIRVAAAAFHFNEAAMDECVGIFQQTMKLAAQAAFFGGKARAVSHGITDTHICIIVKRKFSAGHECENARHDFRQRQQPLFLSLSRSDAQQISIFRNRWPAAEFGNGSRSGGQAKNTRRQVNAACPDGLDFSL
jgi:hypothetical protein